jgi:hypothetical protein
MSARGDGWLSATPPNVDFFIQAQTSPVRRAASIELAAPSRKSESKKRSRSKDEARAPAPASNDVRAPAALPVAPAPQQRPATPPASARKQSAASESPAKTPRTMPVAAVDPYVARALGAPLRFDAVRSEVMCVDCTKPLRPSTAAAGGGCHFCARSESKKGWQGCTYCEASYCHDCVRTISTDTRYDAVRYLRCRKCASTMSSADIAAHRRACRAEAPTARKATVAANRPTAPAPAPVAVERSGGPQKQPDTAAAATPLTSAPHVHSPIESSSSPRRPAAHLPHVDEAFDLEDADDLPTTTVTNRTTLLPLPVYEQRPAPAAVPPRSVVATAKTSSTFLDTSLPTNSTEALLLASASKAQAALPSTPPPSSKRRTTASRNEELFRMAASGNVIEVKGLPPSATAARIAQFLNAASDAAVTITPDGVAIVEFGSRMQTWDALSRCSDHLFDGVQLRGEVSARNRDGKRS